MTDQIFEDDGVPQVEGYHDFNVNKSSMLGSTDQSIRRTSIDRRSVLSAPLAADRSSILGQSQKIDRRSLISSSSNVEMRSAISSPRISHKDYNRYKYYSALRTGYKHLAPEEA